MNDLISFNVILKASLKLSSTVNSCVKSSKMLRDWSKQAMSQRLSVTYNTLLLSICYPGEKNTLYVDQTVVNMMKSLISTVFLLLLRYSYVQALAVKVLKPPSTKQGVEGALLIAPGAYIKGEAYESLGESMNIHDIT